jgi:hypothetical protein
MAGFAYTILIYLPLDYVKPGEVIGFFSLPNSSTRIMTQGSTQPLTEMSTRNLSEGKGRPGRKTDNLTAICGPIV